MVRIAKKFVYCGKNLSLQYSDKVYETLPQVVPHTDKISVTTTSTLKKSNTSPYSKICQISGHVWLSFPVLIYKLMQYSLYIQIYYLPGIATTNKLILNSLYWFWKIPLIFVGPLISYSFFYKIFIIHTSLLS